MIISQCMGCKLCKFCTYIILGRVVYFVVLLGAVSILCFLFSIEYFVIILYLISAIFKFIVSTAIV